MIKKLLKKIIMWATADPVINAEKVIIGKNVTFGRNVVITGFKNLPLKYLRIGDNCVLHEGVRIAVSPKCIIGKNNIIHNNVHIIGDQDFTMGDNNWIGERTSLDSTGKLSIGHRNTIGYNCMIWSHIIRPKNTYTFMPAGCRDENHAYELNPTPGIDKRKCTVIGDKCWLMGGNIQVSPGVYISDRSIIYSNAVVSKSTEYGERYAGIPARKI